MIEYAVGDFMHPAKLEDIRLKGAIEAQMEIFFYERILSPSAKEVIYRETEEQFTLRLDDSKAAGMWRGEFWGKWIIGACRAAKYKKDEELKKFIHEAALRVIATADESGYIGTYRNPERYFAPTAEEAMEALGHPSRWNWNIWCRKYTLWGLLEAYELTGDEKILKAAEKATDQMIDMLEKNGTRLFDTGTFNGLPSGSIMKPMLILYRITENRRYLDFCLKEAEEWQREDGHIPNLIKNAFSGKPVHTWYPNPEEWTKAYEMMSCLDGILELYRVTGERLYLEAVQNIAELLKEYELNTLFSVGFNDLFLNAKNYINSCSEPCDAIHWMRVLSELYKLTGKAEYMEYMEYAFLNPFLAASFADGKWGARAVRTSGRHQVAVFQSSMEHSHCCVNNMPRGYMNAAEMYAVQNDSGIYVNMFTPCEICFEDAEIDIGGAYLESGNVSVSVKAKKDTHIHIRIPSWSTKTLIGGKEVQPVKGYACVPVCAGEEKIEISFELNARLRIFEGETEYLPYESIYHRRFITGNDIPSAIMTWERKATVLVGPLLLTRSKLAGNTEEEMFAEGSVLNDGIMGIKAESLESGAVRNLFRITLSGEKEKREILMCDYATGTNRWSEDDDKLFNVYI